MARVERGLEEAVYEGMAWGCLVGTEQGVLVLCSIFRSWKGPNGQQVLIHSRVVDGLHSFWHITRTWFLVSARL